MVSSIRLALIIKANYDTNLIVVARGPAIHLQVLEPELAVFSLCLPVLYRLWSNASKKYFGVGERSSQSHQMHVLPSSGTRKGEEHALRWSESATTQDRSGYDVSVGVRMLILTAPNPDLSGQQKKNLKPASTRTPHRKVKSPQPAELSIQLII